MDYNTDGEAMLLTTVWCVCDHREGGNNRLCRMALGCPILQVFEGFLFYKTDGEVVGRARKGTTSGRLYYDMEN